MTTKLGDCKICQHPLSKEIHQEIEKGTHIVHIPMMFGNSFSRATLYNHISDCLQSNNYYFTEKAKLKVIDDIGEQLQPIIQITKEGIQAARDVLLVDGVMNFHPRESEIKVIYEHPFIKDQDGKAVTMTDSLENVLDLLRENGIKVKKTILKQEDARKTLREYVASFESILDKMFRFFGNRDQNPTHQQYDRIRAMLEAIAIKKQISYRQELIYFLDVYKKTLRPDLSEMLSNELRLLPVDTDGGIGVKETPLGGGFTGAVVRVETASNIGDKSEITLPESNLTKETSLPVNESSGDGGMSLIKIGPENNSESAEEKIYRELFEEKE